MANKLIDELIIKVKQQGAKPTEKAIKGVAEAFDEAKKNTNAFNSASERVPKFLKKIEDQANRTAKSVGNIKLNIGGNIEQQISGIEDALHALITETQDLHSVMAKSANNTEVLFGNLANELGADMEKIQDGLIDVEKQAGKTGDAFEKLGKQRKKSTRGQANQNRQGRNQARTFSDIAKAAGPLPLLYANIAANVFALSEAFRLISEGEQLNRLEDVGTIIGSKIGTPVQLIAGGMQELTGHTLSYGEAMRNAAAAASYGFDSEQIEQLTMAARRASIALGVDMQDAMNRVIRGTSKLEIELLDELGITTKLTTAYSKYAQQLGVNAKSLNSYQQRAALVNEINAQSVEKFGDLDAMLRDGAPWETFGANTSTAFQTFFKNLAEATQAVPAFFNEIEDKARDIRKPIEEANQLFESFTMSKERGGMVGLLIEAQGQIEQLQAKLSVLQQVNTDAFSLSEQAAYRQEVKNIHTAINTLQGIINQDTLGIPDLQKADEAYRNLNAAVKGSVQSYTASLAAIKGQSTAYEKLYSDVKGLQDAYNLLARTDPNFNASKTLQQLGFDSKFAMDSAVHLAKTYRDTNRELAIFAKTQAEAELQGSYQGARPEQVKLDLLKQQETLYTKLLVDQQRLGASATATAKTSASISKINSQMLDTRVALVDAHIKEKNTQTELMRAGEPELLIKKELLVNERTRLANLQLIQGTHLAQEQSLNSIKQLENEILAIQLQQGNAMMDSAFSNLASFAPGIDQMTGSLNNLSMSFNAMGQSSMTATQMVASGLQAFQGMLQYTGAQATATIDKQIAAEKKRDGKSAESVAKINALEKKKTDQQKKHAKAQILISTAVATMMAAANPWPFPAIPLMASAALAGGMALSQANSASANLMEGSSESAKASLTVGKRDTSIDVSQKANAGELSYLRGGAGMGGAQSFTPRANGGVGIPGNSLVVGEDGPEVITPLEPIRVYSAEDSAASGGQGAARQASSVPLIGSISAMDSQSIIDRAEDIYAAIEEAANARGRTLNSLS